MNAALLNIYHRLPHGARTALASARGYQLRTWRYGRETDTLVQEALERERWSADRWEQWTAARLDYILGRAAARVPYYRDQWHGRRGDTRRLADWPVLSKAALREQPRAFVADDRNTRSMFAEHTSGTSGSPLHLWWSRGTVRAWYALFEARCRLWYGVSRHDRWAILGGQLIVPFARRTPPFWVWNRWLNQLYLSSHHLAPDLIPAYVGALRAHKIEYIWGYPSALFAIAQELIRAGERLPMRVAVTNAEPVEPYQREIIAEAFQCPVRETYGMAEIVAAASECAEGRLHWWPDAGVVEVLGDDGRFGARTGALVGTSLLNDDMPLIRYDVGDRVTLPAVQIDCACGRTMPVAGAIDGRADDVLVTADGRRIGRLDTAFKSGLPIREAQIIQESPAVIRVRYVPEPGFGPAAAADLCSALRDRLGDVSVTLEEVERVPRTSNGKFRAVISKLPQAAPIRNHEA